MSAIFTALETKRYRELTVTTKENAFEVLCETFGETEGTVDITQLLAKIRERESIGSTFVGNGIAIPHTITKDGTELLCALGWSRDGILYDPESNTRAHIFCLYAVPETKRNEYLKEIAKVAQYFSAAENSGKSAGIKDVGEFTQIFYSLADKSIAG